MFQACLIQVEALANICHWNWTHAALLHPPLQLLARKFQAIPKSPVRVEKEGPILFSPHSQILDAYISLGTRQIAVVYGTTGQSLAISEGGGGDRPWRLKASVVHSWRAHRERMRALAVTGSEGTVVTAGRGLVNGRDSEVVRCWRLSDGAPGVPKGPGPTPFFASILLTIPALYHRNGLSGMLALYCDPQASEGV